MRSTRWPALLAVTAMLAACGSLGESGEDDGEGAGGKVTLSWLVDNSEQTLKPAEALAKAFTAKHPDITIKVETRPQGGDGDNVVKTRLATSEMTDLFMYNSGSLFQALSPEKNLVPLSDEPWAANLEDAFKQSVTAGGNLYGAPFGGSIGGGILYNRKVYDELGLEVPKTWAEFMANNAKLKAAGIDPVIQTYQDTWTSQLLLLANHHNVAAADPGWAEKYTNNQVKFAQEPGLEGFQRLEQVHTAGFENKDYRSAKFDEGLALLATGKGAHYPMLTFAVGAIANANPQEIGDVGFFAQPGNDAASNGLTLWISAGVYIPKTTTGAKLAAAKQFLAFVASKEGCDVQTEAFTPSGPYLTKGCTLPDDVPQAIKDIQPYLDGGNVTPALEFLSPVKGPALEHITVEVGSGLRSAKSGAELYDQDVEKQAQQLGLEGW
jgi:raffinose/stachyose/melibiose transport system substrate-binding protein